MNTPEVSVQIAPIGWLSFCTACGVTAIWQSQVLAGWDAIGHANTAHR